MSSLLTLPPIIVVVFLLDCYGRRRSVSWRCDRRARHGPPRSRKHVVLDQARPPCALVSLVQRKRNDTPFPRLDDVAPRTPATRISGSPASVWMLSIPSLPSRSLTLLPFDLARVCVVVNKRTHDRWPPPRLIKLSAAGMTWQVSST